MHRLGYTRYVAQGGDVGALVTDLMGRQAVEGLVGYHLNLLTAVLAIGDQLPKESEQERAAAEALATFREDGLLLPRNGNAATVHRLRPAGLTRRAGGLVARPRHGQLLQDLPRLRRRRARGQSHPGHHRRQHHAVLADRHLSVGGPVVLGGRTSAGRSACERPASSAGLGSGRLHDVPLGEIWAAPRSWVETVYPGLAYFNEVDRGGHLRRGKSPSSSPRRCTCGVQAASLKGPREPVRYKTCPFSRRRGSNPPGSRAHGWLNSAPLSPSDLRERRARRLLDVHLHQPAAHAFLCPRLVERHTESAGSSSSASTRRSSCSNTTSRTSVDR